MIVTNSHFRLTLGAALLAGTAVLGGCASEPVTRTTVNEQTTTTAPPPLVATATISTSEDAQKPVRAAHVPRRRARYAMHRGRPIA
jgi:uncharacterized lipoprotein YajG